MFSRSVLLPKAKSKPKLWERLVTGSSEQERQLQHSQPSTRRNAVLAEQVFADLNYQSLECLWWSCFKKVFLRSHQHRTNTGKKNGLHPLKPSTRTYPKMPSITVALKKRKNLRNGFESCQLQLSFCTPGRTGYLIFPTNLDPLESFSKLPLWLMLGAT